MKIEVNTHEKNMIRFAAEHSEVVVMSADLGSSCEVKKFRQVYPDRYLTMGIAEQNMCSWAAGMAREGYRPFLHTFAVFLYRRILDQLEMSVAYPQPAGRICRLRSRHHHSGRRYPPVDQ